MVYIFYRLEMIKDIVLKIHPNDNVLVALKDLELNTSVKFENETYILKDKIPAKHKFSIKQLAIGDAVYMYGVLVGKVKKAIVKGGIINTSNLEHDAEIYSSQNKSIEIKWNAPDTSKFRDKTFLGYHRKDGKVGTENNWLVIPLVFCQNRNVNVLKEALLDKLGFSSAQHLRFDVDILINEYKKGASKETLLERDISNTFNQQQKNYLFFPIILMC